MELASPALAGEFFTTSLPSNMGIREAHIRGHLQANKSLPVKYDAYI